MSAIANLVNKFVADLEAAVRAEAFESVQRALGGKAAAASSLAAPARRRPGRPKKSAAPAAAPAKAPIASAPAKKATAASKGAKRGGRRSSEDVAKSNQANADRIYQYVKAHQGTSAEAIRTALKLAKTDWNQAINLLKDGGKVTMKGEKRGATYSAK